MSDQEDRKYKRWTDEESKQAQKLWATGMSVEAISIAINRPKGSVYNHIELNRHKFPRRRAATKMKGGVRTDVKLNVYIPKTMHTVIKDAAKIRGGSVSMTVRDAIIIASYHGWQMPEGVLERRLKADKAAALEAKMRRSDKPYVPKPKIAYAGAEND